MAADAADVLARLEVEAVVPVVVIDDAQSAADVGAALAEGGLRCAEITLRTDAGLDAIRVLAQLPGFLVGAGTVLTTDDVDACVEAGAQFVVSPGFDEFVVDHARERGIAVLPGIATASELQRARRHGLDAVKFFPADRLGGLPTIAALAAPFAAMRFMPSGGVSAANIADYLAHPAVFAAGGSWMVPRDAIARRDFDVVRRLAAEVVADLVARGLMPQRAGR